MNFKQLLVIVFGVCLLAGVIGYFGVQKAEITRQQTIEAAEIEKEREAKVQAEKTERTEERSQFWQKVVPWGKDEAEKNETSWNCRTWDGPVLV